MYLYYESHNATSRNAKIRYAEWLYSDCHSAKSRNARFVMLGGVILGVIMPSDVILRVALLNLTILGVTLLFAIQLSVVAPRFFPPLPSKCLGGSKQ